MKAKIWWSVGVGVFVLLLLASVKYGEQLTRHWQGEEFVPRDTIAQIEFDDESLLKILQIGESSMIDGSTKAPLFGHSGSSTQTYARIQITDHTVNEELAGITFTGRDGDLLVELQLSGRQGRAIFNDAYLDAGGRINHQLGSEKESSVFLTADEFLATPLADSSVEFVLQLQDGSGGWITAKGPLTSKDDELKRSVVVFEGWARNQKEFIFRALRRGTEAKEFSVPNRYFQAVGTPWSTSQLPVTHREPDFTLELAGVKEKIVPEKGRILQLDEKFTTRFKKKVQRKWSLEELSYKLLYVTSPDGGRHHLSSIWTAKQRAFQGVPFPMLADKAKFTYEVQRNRAYPFKRTDVVILAAGEVSADGRRINLDTFNRVYGVTKFSCVDIKKDSGESFTQVEISGEWANEAEKKAAARVFSENFSSSFLVGFVDNDDFSSGYSQVSGSGTSTSMGGTTFDLSESWYHDFKPGQRISFGRVRKPNPKIMTFVVDVPTSKKSGNED